MCEDLPLQKPDYSYRDGGRQKDDSKAPFYFGRSSSAQNNTHKTLFYQHAFSTNNKGPKEYRPFEREPYNSPAEASQTPCAKCVTLIGGVFLKTFQELIIGLQSSETREIESVDYDTLANQVDQIRATIDRLKYTALKTESQENLSRLYK